MPQNFRDEVEISPVVIIPGLENLGLRRPESLRPTPSDPCRKAFPSAHSRPGAVEFPGPNDKRLAA